MFPWTSLRRRPVPAGDLTAALEPMYTDGTSGKGVGLTGFPRFLDTRTDGDGVRYARLLIGFGPDAHVIVRTPDAKWFACLAEAGVAAYDELNPVPAAMEETA